MNKVSKFTILSLSACLLTACGGGGGNRNDGASDEPLTPYNSFGSLQNQGRTISAAAGSDGDIVATIDEESEINFELADGLATMNIDNVERAETYSVTCPDGTDVKVSFFENFATGVERVSATYNGQSLRCSSTYPTGLVPAVVGSSSSIYDLISVSDVSDVGEYISTNCPDESSANNPLSELEDFETDVTICESSVVTDITVTDDIGNTHLISSESISVPD